MKACFEYVFHVRPFCWLYQVYASLNFCILLFLCINMGMCACACIDISVKALYRHQSVDGSEGIERSFYSVCCTVS